VRLALAVVATVSVVAAACGGVEREPNLARASERTAATGSFRVDIDAVGTEAGKRLEFRCEAAIDLERSRARFTCDEYGPTGGVEMIYVGDNQYVREPGTSRWTSLPGDEGPFDGEAISPEPLLDLLRGASRETERIGEEVVRDADTVRYRLTVECEEAELTCPPGETAPVDVWIDDEGLVRRIELEDGDITAALEFYDFGAAFDIEPPPADQVTQDPSSSDPPSCTSGSEHPIRVQKAIDVLGRNGFDMERNEFGCGPGVAAAITNVLGPVYLSCFVLTGPASTPGTLTLSPGPEQVTRDLANLSCTLFFERGREEAVARLDAAFAELKRATRS
jgi:hypothetical protein